MKDLKIFKTEKKNEKVFEVSKDLKKILGKSGNRIKFRKNIIISHLASKSSILWINIVQTTEICRIEENPEKMRKLDKVREKNIIT